jgi:hypothetical protein
MTADDGTGVPHQVPPIATAESRPREAQWDGGSASAGRGAGVGLMARLAGWLARSFLLAGTIGLPLLLAVSISGDQEAWTWVRYSLAPLFVICAIVGTAYAVRRWPDPPIWAWILSKALPYRDEWRRGNWLPAVIEMCRVSSAEGRRGRAISPRSGIPATRL